MIFSRVINHLRLNGRSSTRDIAATLDITPAALREMLKLLESKGRVRRLPSGTTCSGGCVKCAPDTIELYELTR